MNNELTLEVKCFSLLCRCAYSYVFILALHLNPHRLQHLYVCVCVCVMEYKCNGGGVGGCSFILLIQGQFLIMQSEYTETLQEHMH